MIPASLLKDRESVTCSRSRTGTASAFVPSKKVNNLQIRVENKLLNKITFLFSSPSFSRFSAGSEGIITKYYGLTLRITLLDHQKFPMGLFPSFGKGSVDRCRHCRFRHNGSLMTHELCRAGIKCCIVDKRSIATGSSAASTALLQYEIDVPLCRMGKIIGEENAATAYHACLQSISDIKRVLEETESMPVSNNCPASFMPVVRRITNFWNKSMKYGKKHKLPVSLLEKKKIREEYKVKTPGNA